MGSPKAARTVNRGRIYTINGQSLWSVTSIIGNGLPKPAIAGWQSRTIAEYAVANWRAIGAMLEAVRLRRDGDGDTYGHVVSDPDAVAAAVDWLKGAPWRESQRKMNLGSAVHTEAEAYVLGTPRPEPPLTIAPFVQSFRHFLDDFDPIFEMTEATVYNTRESYAGTLDAIMTIGGRQEGPPDAIITVGGRRLLVDYKTGKDIYADVALQLAAYAHAEAILLDDGTSVPMLPVDGAAALHLREYDPAVPGDRGYSLIPVDIADTDPLAVPYRQSPWDAFRQCREVMRWMETTSKGVLSQPITNPVALAALYPATIDQETA